jgi:hypothetical protein
MSIDHPEASRALPDRPNLRHLKDQAKDLFKASAAASITDAQFKIARLYGFASWPKLKAHIDSLEEIGQLKRAIDTNDIVRVKSMMTRTPTLHSAPLGYAKDGPLTWVPECRPMGITESGETGDGEVDARARVGCAPGRRRTADASRAQWRSHPDDGGARVPRCGCKRSVAWTFSHHLCPCESLDPAAFTRLLDHGANPNCRDHGFKVGDHLYPGTALDYVIASYARSPNN